MNSSERRNSENGSGQRSASLGPGQGNGVSLPGGREDRGSVQSRGRENRGSVRSRGREDRESVRSRGREDRGSVQNRGHEDNGSVRSRGREDNGGLQSRGRGNTPSGREGAAYAAGRRADRSGRGNTASAQGRRQGSSYSGRKVGTASRSYARTRGRRKKGAQKIVLLMFLAFLVIMIAVGVFGIRRFLRNKARNALREEGIASIEAGDYENAITKLDEALSYSGGKIGEFETEVLEARAEAEYLETDYTASLHTWKILLENDGNSRKYKEGAVLCLLETGSLEEALAMEALQSRVYNKMAVEQIEAREYERALETIERGIQAPEKSAMEDLLYNQAAAYGYMGEFQKSLELFEAYEAEYGPNEKAEREITFLKSRVPGAED